MYILIDLNLTRLMLSPRLSLISKRFYVKCFFYVVHNSSGLYNDNYLKHSKFSAAKESGKLIYFINHLAALD